jgi:hypothetical protein
VGKSFHPTETAFRFFDLYRFDRRSRGWENFSPSRLYPPAGVDRNTRARMSRDVFGSISKAGSVEALGISSRISERPGEILRAASSIPPALTLRAVVNSNNSLELRSWVRTNTGIGRGNRSHFRLSTLDLVPFIDDRA